MDFILRRVAHCTGVGKRDWVEDAVHYASIIVLYQTNICMFLRIFNGGRGCFPARHGLHRHSGLLFIRYFLGCFPYKKPIRHNFLFPPQSEWVNGNCLRHHDTGNYEKNCEVNRERLPQQRELWRGFSIDFLGH
jgi:hypothetical protein